MSAQDALCAFFLFVILFIIVVAAVGGSYGWGRVHRQIQLAQQPNMCPVGTVKLVPEADLPKYPNAYTIMPCGTKPQPHPPPSPYPSTPPAPTPPAPAPTPTPPAPTPTPPAPTPTPPAPAPTPAAQGNVAAAWVAFQDVKITSATVTKNLEVPSNCPFDKFNMLIGFVALPQDVANGAKVYDIHTNKAFQGVATRVLCLGGGPYKWTQQDLQTSTMSKIIDNCKKWGWNGIQLDIEIVYDNAGSDLKKALTQIKSAGLYSSVTVYYEPGNQGGGVASVFSYKDVFQDADSIMVQLYAGPGTPNSGASDPKYPMTWYYQKKTGGVPYCAGGWGLSTCPGPQSATKEKLVWGIALGPNNTFTQKMDGYPPNAKNNICLWCLGGPWAPKDPQSPADPMYKI